MTARAHDPARRARSTGSRASRPVEPDGTAKPDTAVPAGSHVALTGLAVAADRPDQLRTGLQALQVRPKLLVGRADDPAEAEADTLADAVVHRMLQPGPAGPDQPAAVLGALRRTPAGPAPATGNRPAAGMGLAGGEVDAGTEQALRAAGTSGTALAPALRREYEDAFGADFSAVRVHSGPASAGLNAALGARAFTLGSDIYFGDRVPDSASAADRHLLAHELAHTLQDGGTAHRAVLRRLAVQITPSHYVHGEAASNEAGIEVEVDEEMPELGAVLDPHPPVHAGPVLAPGPEPVEEDLLGEDLPGGAVAEPAYELFVETVAIVGRPAPLFGSSMGDHMTAFVISRKGVENAIAGQPFSVAVDELKAMAAELAKLPGWGLVDALKPVEAVEAVEAVDEDVEEEEPSTSTGGPVTAPASAVTLDLGSGLDLGGGEPDLGESSGSTGGRHRRASHHARFVTAKEHLDTCQALLDSADSDDLKIVRLQDYIAAYLELRELVPLSVSDWKGANRSRGGKGDGESGLPGFLADPETGRQPPGQLRRDFVSTIATFRMAQAAIEPNAEALAVLMPGLDPTLDADERTELMAQQHVQSVLTNFPLNFGALADDILLAEGLARARVAVQAEAERRRLAMVKRGKGKSSAKRKLADSSSSESEEEEEDVGGPLVGAAEAAPVERTEEQNFAIIQNHLVRLVKMRYAEAAAVELKHQQKVIALHDGDELGDAAKLDAQKLTSYLTTGSAPSSASEGESHATKRSRGSETDVVDDVYGTLSAAEAKLVYTGRDLYQDKKKKPSPGAELAVQVVLDGDGAVLDVAVERQGRFTKGAHTLPWMQWVTWLAVDIKGKQPAAALAAFRSTTEPAIRKLLHPDSPVPDPSAVPSVVTVMDTTAVPGPVAVAEAKEERAGGAGPVAGGQHAAGRTPGRHRRDAGGDHRRAGQRRAGRGRHRRQGRIPPPGRACRLPAGRADVLAG